MVQRASHMPAPIRAPKANVYAFAEKVSLRLKLAPGGPLDPLVSKLGGKIFYGAGPGVYARHPESMIVRSDKDFTIYVPSMTSMERDRFTIAHELGHFFLHYPAIKAAHPQDIMSATRWVDEDNEIQQRAEWEANWFAAAFLMRSDDFRRIVNEKRHSLVSVALAFAVSTQAAQIRSKSLGLRLE